MNEDLRILLFYRRYYLSIKKLYGRGFDDTLAGSMLRFTEKNIKRIIKRIDISDAFSELEY